MKYFSLLRGLIPVLAALLALPACSGGGGNNNGALSSDKALTSFSLVAPASAGIIDESAKTVSVIVPSGTDLTALVASFTASGTSVKVGDTVQVSGATANDFTRAVAYLVTAEDKTTATYTVTIATPEGFGIRADDQLRRYQTFIAGPHPALTGVEVKVRKKSAADFYSCLSVELYETDAGHRPAVLLAVVSLPTDTLTTDFAVLGAPLLYYGLAPGREYAVVLEQYNAFGANAGFEWSVNEKNADTYFGKQENGVWIDESRRGDGWLSVYADDSAGTNPAAGSPDTSFGTGGTATISVANMPSPQSVLVQPDGKIVTALFDVLNMSGFMLSRHNADGSLDTTFNATGIVSTPIGTNSSAHAAVLQPDGKIVAAGSTYDGVISAIALARYNTDGSLDTTFNATGLVTTTVGTNSYAVAAALQPDGKIVVAGDTAGGFVLVRYNPGGSLDTTFNGTGTTITPFAYSNLRAVAIQPDGKIVAAGSASSGITLVRYNSDGSLDTTFNSTGIVTTTVGVFSAAGAVAIQPDGRIVAAGSSFTSGFVLVRYNSNGSLDTTFNATGQVLTPIGTTSSSASAVALQPDGKIVAAGGSNSGSWSFAVARYNSDGSLDTTFNSTGIAIALTGTSSGATAVAIQPDGKITAAGMLDAYLALVRFHE